jgi:allantoicase
MAQFSFEQMNLAGIDYAYGYLQDGLLVEGTRKMFPAFAAGAMGTSHDMLIFLQDLTNAYHNKPSKISHDTAVLMLHGQDLGCREFMAADIGLGIFVTEAGDNRIAIHQGANDGFRCLYLYCYDGPDIHKGLCILCNADFNGVFFNAEVTQYLLKTLGFSGINFELFKTDFAFNNLKTEEIVNIGYKKLIFDAFEPMLPEAIVNKGKLDPLADYNLAVSAKIIKVSNQKFARAENLISPYLPVFDPTLFGKQGKIMDSWETVRHNPLEFDEQILELKKPSTINYISLSTMYHFGNQVKWVAIDYKENDDWKILLAKTAMEGHSIKRIKLDFSFKDIKLVKIKIYPDGGFSRLGLFENLPENEKDKFQTITNAKCEVFTEKIPHTSKPLSLVYKKTNIQSHFSKLKKGEEFNLASRAYGAELISSSNEHYGPAAQVISPYPAIHMFDGLESARSHKKDHYEECVIKLAKAMPIKRIEMDFKYFVNNNPDEMMIWGLSDSWKPLVTKTYVKPFAGNIKIFEIFSDESYSQIKIQIFPDGGINRVRVIGVHT